MAKIRVYELARELGLPAAELRKHLNEVGVEIKSASSTLDEETAQTVRELFQKQPETAVEAPPPESGLAPIELPMSISVRDFAAKLNTDASDLVAELIKSGVLATVNQQISFDIAVQLARNHGFTPVRQGEGATAVAPEPVARPAVEAAPRPPVVTVMGHVDHGKTTLLDAVRHTNVTEQEVGGITQHIGAYQVSVEGRRITFIDTPGHWAFTAMRARGAKATDIAVLVIGADDGVMPQTVEAIDHARAANVPIIVAVNKIDRPEANPDRVKHQLMEHNVLPEEWGGDVACVPISAKQGTGIPDLLEIILLQADELDLRADRSMPARGTVIEAKMDPRRGSVATLLVQEGTLRVGDAVIAGKAYGRVRAMTDDREEPIAFAGPSTPALITGLSKVPDAGDLFNVVADERTAKLIAGEREMDDRSAGMRGLARVSLQDFYEQMQQEGTAKELRIVLKCDVQGTIEALRKSLDQLEHAEVHPNIIHAGVGDISESDVMLASASNGIIIGFQVRVDAQARKAAEDERIEIRLYRVIYDVIDDVKAALLGMLAPTYEEVIVGRAEVRAVFKISRLGAVAGCYVTDGQIVRGGAVRIIRSGEVIHTGKLDSLRHIKDDVREMAEGFECGISLSDFHEWQEADIIEHFAQREVRRETL